MPDVTQRFILEAADTLRTLDLLDRRFSRLAQTLTQINATGFNATANQVSANLNNISQAVNTASVRASQSLRETSQAGVRSARELTVSWETMARVVTTQFIVRSLSQLRNAFTESTQTAIEFQRAISQVQTIAAGATFAELSNQVRAVSDSFNIPVVEAAQGLYQTLSNQVGDTATSFQFYAEAAKFAAATNSTTADAVDLLSGVLKSFNIDASQTGLVASQLFKTIDLGRVSASDLANTFGRIGPIAANLGVSFQELQAALATLTINGLSVSEAITQINGVMTALQKPSEAGKQAIRNLGFESAQQAVATLGFAGTLQALAQASDGSAEAFSALVPRVRGLNAFIALGSRQTETFRNNLEQISGVNLDFLNEKFELVAQTAGFKVTTEVNKLKNVLTVDLGQAFLESAANALQFVGGVDGVTGAVRVVTPALEIGAGVLAIYATRAVAAAAASRVFASSLGPLAAAGAAVAGAVTLGNVIGNAIEARRNAGLNQQLGALQQAQQAELAQITQAESARVREADKANQAVLRDRLRLIRDVSATYIQDLDNARSANDAYVANTKQALERILNARRDLVKSIADAEQDAFSQIEASRQRAANLTQGGQDRQFQFQISGLSDAQRIVALQGQSQKIAQDASKSLANASSEGQVQKALQQFERARGFAQQALQLAQSSGASTQQSQAVRNLEKLDKTQVESESKLQQLQASRAQQLKQQEQTQTRISAELEKQAQLVAKNTSLLNKDGKPLSGAEQADQLKKQQDALNSIIKSALSPEQSKQLVDLGLGQAINKLKQDLSATPVQLRAQLATGAAEIRAQVERAFESPVIVKLSAELGQDLRGKTTQELIQAAQDVTQQQTKAAEAQAAQNVSKQAAENLKAQVRTIIAEFDSANEQLNRSSAAKVSQKGQEFAQGLQNARNAIQGVLQTGDASIAKLQAILLAIQPVFQANQGLLGSFPTLKNSVDQLSVAVGKLQELNTVQSNLSAATQEAAALKAELEAAAAAAAQIQVGGGGAGARFNGGPIRFLANGGRGLDKVHTMLDPREFVSTARASQRFATQLTAMNAGFEPNFRSNGGTSITVGDINIQESESPRQTAREVMRAIRREQRRGSSRLRM